MTPWCFLFISDFFYFDLTKILKIYGPIQSTFSFLRLASWASVVWFIYYIEMAWQLSEFLISLVKEVVDGGHLVVFIGIQTLLSLFLLESILFKHTDDWLFQRDFVFTDYQPQILNDRSVSLRVPRMIDDLVSCVSFYRVDVEDFVDQTAASFRDPIWYFKFSFHYLLIENGGIGIFEW